MPANYYSCVNVKKDKGLNPMDPYTFTTTLAAGRESVTTLHLSASSVGCDHERTVRFPSRSNRCSAARPRARSASRSAGR
jgi:hypothetical protein